MRIILLLEPHFGTLYSWNPILRGLAQAGRHRIAVAVPCECYLHWVPKDDFGLRHGSDFTDEVIMANLFGFWKRYSSLIEAHSRASRSWGLFGRIVHKGSHHIPRLRKLFMTRVFSSLDAIDSAEIVLWDVLGKPMGIVPFRRRLLRARWFSIPHGINPWMTRESLFSIKGARLVSTMLTRAFLPSQLDKPLYLNAYDLVRNQVRVVGVPRHDPEWIKWQNSLGRTEFLNGKPFIFVTSRQSNNDFFGEAQKINALKAIQQLAKSLGLGVVIRRHPKEQETELFQNCFGPDGYGSTWEFTAMPPAVVGTSSLLAISFLSSTIVDLVAAQVAVIQFFDTTGLESDPQFFPDGKGNLLTKYQLLGFVLHAGTPRELGLRAEQVIQNRSAVVRQQFEAYKKVYSDPKGAISRVLGDLYC